MGVSLTVLASGSRGNTALVCSSRTRVLVDAGISCRETFKRLKAVGEDPHQLNAIVITHEHSDHVAGLAVLARKLGIPIFMTGLTHHAWARSERDATGVLPVQCAGQCSVRRLDGGNAAGGLAGLSAAMGIRSRHRVRARADRILHAAARGLRRGVCTAR